MFTCYKDISGLNLHSSTKSGYESTFLMEILNHFNILNLLHFFKTIEHYFNIPLFSDIITSAQYIDFLLNPTKMVSKYYLITRFLQIIKDFFLVDNVLTLITKLYISNTDFTKKIFKTKIQSWGGFKPLILGQVYGHYQGSVIPFYIDSSSWYLRTGLLSDEKLLIIIIIIPATGLMYKTFLFNFPNLKLKN